MGNVASSIASASNNAVKSVTGRKRKYIEEDKFDTDCRIIDETMQTPKRCVGLTHQVALNNYYFYFIYLQKKIVVHSSIHIQDFVQRREGK